ncbi:OLC1v1004261C1 [Oldenlandia corymbosa var. corymbosa]|uniref:OLC1v1004261C1 n=1 Tax=Oldenlandia corymbosa var. corymbosa TaxID=529605 RepID=A0AAV1DEA0_OLDCO|nr:OLC1v1004261C1 [Oldenlandia corymbosa var. corymbosa]
MCDSSGFSNATNGITQLFCEFTLNDLDMKYQLHGLDYERETYAVRNGKSWVGRAYSLNKVCFSKDTTQFSISDYPLLPLVRSGGVSGCFAIPLQLIHHKLHPFILELFLIPKQQCDGDVGALLKSILSTLAQELSKCNVDFGLRQTEEFSVECSHSDDDKMVHFDVCRCRIVTDDSNVLQDDIGKTTWEAFPNGAQLTVSDTMINELLQVQYSNQALSLSSGCEREVQQIPSSSYQQPPVVEIFDHITTRQDVGETSRNGEVEITLNTIRQHFGKNLKDAAEELGVSPSTLKRKCREYDIKRWPSHKRNKVQTLQPAARGLPTTKSTVTHCPNNISTRAEKDANTMIVKATYKDDIVMFPLSNTSGIKELRKELNERFPLEAQKFKIKYQHEGDWILIACEKDLRFRVNTLKSSGQSTVSLSIFQVSN